MRILLVEDEPKIAKALEEGLVAESHSIRVAATGESGFFLASSESFDVVILDVMLPDRSGFDVVSAMRKQGLRIPVLLLTARDAVEDRVAGLDAGADDYLVKPFAFPELSARIRALARRGNADPVLTLTLQDLRMDVVSRTVFRGTSRLELTAKEFDLLEYLLRHQGRVVSREMLSRDVWKETARHSPLDNVIDVHMARIRRKVDDGFSSKVIHTVRGVGFVARTEPA